MNPIYLNAYNNRAAIYLLQKKYDSALEDFNKIIKSDAKNADAYFNRSVTYKFKGEFSEALKDAYRAESLGYPETEAYIKELEGLK